MPAAPRFLCAAYCRTRDLAVELDFWLRGYPPKLERLELAQKQRQDWLAFVTSRLPSPEHTTSRG